MCQNQLLITVLMTLLLHGEIIVPIADATAYRILHDFIQYNVAGIPILHEKTKWNFDPEVGKQRRIQYEQDNGRYGEYAIAKLGMGIGYKGSWGLPVQS
ncbi:PREDICTED: uncharacterized protein LOC105461810 [Wasmannia auropunctata]|uniref:uncharacterized protein LOC105461810 n=1 Tax=Wasmannia auropunctata TaxID=64793 RepID=UPI0005EDB249|nr:PREDICTED: uncharacterized protein LOC105461810 [Wasmannia auropunctata]XP_011706622.1 PREDICTED: uncharacterized protein LOC105461810 [Wasmannia auropunctata]